MFLYKPTNTTDGFVDKSPLYSLRGDRSGSGRPGAKNSRSCFLRLRSRSDFGHDLVHIALISTQAARVRPSSFFGILTHLIKATMSDTIEGDTSRSPRFTHWCTLFVFRYVLRSTGARATRVPLLHELEGSKVIFICGRFTRPFCADVTFEHGWLTRNALFHSLFSFPICYSTIVLGAAVEAVGVLARLELRSYVASWVIFHLSSCHHYSTLYNSPPCTRVLLTLAIDSNTCHRSSLHSTVLLSATQIFKIKPNT